MQAIFLDFLIIRNENARHVFGILGIRYEKRGLRLLECSKVCKGQGYSTTLSLTYVSIWVIKGLVGVTREQDDKVRFPN